MKFKEEIKQFVDSDHKYEFNTNLFPLSCFSVKYIRDYYKIRKRIIGLKQYRIHHRPPLHMWLLIKYLFEIVFFIIHILLFSIYIVNTPVFKGRISFYFGIFALSYLLFRKYAVKMRYKSIRVLRYYFESLRNK